MAGPVGWLRARMGVRVVSALSAAVVVAAALVVVGAVLVLLVSQSLRDNVKEGAEQRAELIAARLSDNFQGAANENAREALDALTTPDDLAQVIVRYGTDPGEVESRVIEGGTDAVGRATPISDLVPEDRQVIVVPDTTITRVDGSTVRSVLVAIGTTSDSRDVVLLLAVPLTDVEEATETLLFYLTWGVPVLIVVAGLATYLFAGRALRPVEAIRAQVAEMTEKDLARRVPVPVARDEVGRLAETMNAMIARLQDAQGVQRRFVADASHELRSPLATIATGLELMQNGSTDASMVGALRGETARLNRLVDALILLARADERGLQPRREEVDLDEVAEGERGRPAEGSVVAEVFTEPVRVIGDRGQLARVVRNLVDNARRHARKRVVVTVGRAGDDAVLEVVDDGPGVPAADRARVFERFVRLDDARARSDGGSGLGLAIVAEVVAAHGGTVELEAGPSGGALFRVRLPAAGEREPVEPPARPAGAGDEMAHAAGDSASDGPGDGADDGPGDRFPTLPMPVRDEDARRDPDTNPRGIPMVPSQPGSIIR